MENLLYPFLYFKKFSNNDWNILYKVNILNQNIFSLKTVNFFQDFNVDAIELVRKGNLLTYIGAGSFIDINDGILSIINDKNEERKMEFSPRFIKAISKKKFASVAGNLTIWDLETFQHSSNSLESQKVAHLVSTNFIY